MYLRNKLWPLFVSLVMILDPRLRHRTLSFRSGGTSKARTLNPEPEGQSTLTTAMMPQVLLSMLILSVGYPRVLPRRRTLSPTVASGIRFTNAKLAP